MFDWLMTPPPGLGLNGLFLSAFLSATLLPGNSEIAMVLWLRARPDTVWWAWGIASLGNTLGSLTTFWLGWRLRGLDHSKTNQRLSPRALNWLGRHGALTLLLAWLPLIGDALCFAAGWLRLPIGRSAIAMLLGKSLRYLILVVPFIYA